MSSEYDHFRELLLRVERDRLDALDVRARDTETTLRNVPELVAADIEKSVSGAGESRLTGALSEATAGFLEGAVRRRPQAVIDAVYPVIGPAIRRALAEALKNMAEGLDLALRDNLSPRSFKWRLEAWRTGVPYAHVVLRHTAQCRVEHLLLIRPQSGLLLCHLAADGVAELDPDAVAGMFTAINQFVRDSMSVAGPDSGIASATVGGYKIAVSEGPSARLVAFVRGVPYSGLGERLDEINEEVHAVHGSQLLESTAVEPDTLDLLGSAQLQELNDPTDPAEEVKSNAGRNLIGVALLLVIGFVLFQSIVGYRWSVKVDDINSALAGFPGLFVSDVDGSERGEIRIRGMVDPMAPDPVEWLGERYPDVETEWQLSRFVSLEPDLVRRRLARTLEVPAAVVGLPDALGAVQLEGEVPFGTWHRIQRARLQEPGVSSIGFSGLHYPQQREVDDLVQELEATTVEFVTGSTPTEAAPDRMAAIQRAVERLQDWSQENQARVVLEVSGFTDGVGSESQNRMLRIARAEWLAEALAPSLRPSTTLEIDHSTASAPSARGGTREASIDVSLVPVGG